MQHHPKPLPNPLPKPLPKPLRKSPPRTPSPHLLITFFKIPFFNH